MSESTLGSFSFSRRAFKNIEPVFAKFYEKDFFDLADRKRSDLVNRSLLQLIQEQQEPAFLLPEVLHFIERVDKEDLLHHYIFTSFELWLNQYSGLSEEENYRVRAKIVGKYVPREEYRVFFPVGMGKVFPGTHFVTAHKSPDLDTTIASFWGWLDAFGARVGASLHIWNLPGGPPPSQIEMDLLFREMFGPAIFTHVPKTRTILSLSGNDLMTQRNMLRKKTSEKLGTLRAERTKKAIVIVDEEGYYLGDFRSIDVEGVRQVLMLMNQCLRWFENRLHIDLIQLFSKEDLHLKDVHGFINSIFETVLQDSEQVKDFSEEEKERFSLLLEKVFSIPKGISCTFAELGNALSEKALLDFTKVKESVLSLEKSGLFAFSGRLVENRPLLFSTLAKIIASLHSGIQTIRSYTESLDIIHRVKKDVFSFTPKSVSVRSDVEEIRSKMGSYQYLTVTYPDKDRFFPVGVISAADLRKNVLGTVSLRDFSNRSEMTIPSYLEVISVIDHHKTELSTIQPPMAIISDAQSSNAIVAQQAFLLNERYSTSGMSVEEVEKAKKSEKAPEKLQKLWRFSAILEKKSSYYIHPEREMMEYMHFIYGILDDTDLLSKVSNMDVEIVSSLLNRLKTLVNKRPTSIIELDDLPRNSSFASLAAKRILQNEDMYSLYKKVYDHREKELEKNLIACVNNEPNNIFSDTKDVNGLARVGQTKIFEKNVTTLSKYKQAVQKSWLAKAEKFYQDHSDTDLHLHMISTIVSATEVYQGKTGNYKHFDDLWIWPASTELAIEHLKRFLSAFQTAPELKDKEVYVSFLGKNASDLEMIFQESFRKTRYVREDLDLPLAVIHYPAGTINSRKSMISPYLPVLSN